MIHLPGGPYPYPAPAVMAFLSGCAEIGLPDSPRAWLRDTLCGARPFVHDLIVELTVPDGWPIHITWAAMALAIMAWGRETFA